MAKKSAPPAPQQEAQLAPPPLMQIPPPPPPPVLPPPTVPRLPENAFMVQDGLIERLSSGHRVVVKQVLEDMKTNIQAQVALIFIDSEKYDRAASTMQENSEEQKKPVESAANKKKNEARGQRIGNRNDETPSESHQNSQNPSEIRVPGIPNLFPADGTSEKSLEDPKKSKKNSKRIKKKEGNEDEKDEMMEVDGAEPEDGDSRHERDSEDVSSSSSDDESSKTSEESDDDNQSHKNDSSKSNGPIPAKKPEPNFCVVNSSCDANDMNAEHYIRRLTEHKLDETPITVTGSDSLHWKALPNRSLLHFHVFGHNKAEMRAMIQENKWRQLFDINNLIEGKPFVFLPINIKQVYIAASFSSGLPESERSYEFLRRRSCNLKSIKLAVHPKRINELLELLEIEGKTIIDEIRIETEEKLKQNAKAEAEKAEKQKQKAETEKTKGETAVPASTSKTNSNMLEVAETTHQSPKSDRTAVLQNVVPTFKTFFSPNKSKKRTSTSAASNAQKQAKMQEMSDNQLSRRPESVPIDSEPFKFSIINILLDSKCNKAEMKTKLQSIIRKRTQKNVEPVILKSESIGLKCDARRSIIQFHVVGVKSANIIRNVIPTISWVHLFDGENLEHGEPFLWDNVHKTHVISAILLSSLPGVDEDNDSFFDSVDHLGNLRSALTSETTKRRVFELLNADGLKVIQELCVDNEVEKWTDVSRKKSRSKPIGTTAKRVDSTKTPSEKNPAKNPPKETHATSSEKAEILNATAKIHLEHVISESVQPTERTFYILYVDYERIGDTVCVYDFIEQKGLKYKFRPIDLKMERLMGICEKKNLYFQQFTVATDKEAKRVRKLINVMGWSEVFEVGNVFDKKLKIWNSFEMNQMWIRLLIGTWTHHAKEPSSTEEEFMNKLRDSELIKKSIKDGKIRRIVNKVLNYDGKICIDWLALKTGESLDPQRVAVIKEAVQSDKNRYFPAEIRKILSPFFKG